MARIIAVTNQKGGVGKTTTCVNLSACMAAQGKRVLVVDIDPQGNCTSGFGLSAPEGRSTYEALLDPAMAGECILKTCVDNLELMPSGMQLAGAEIELIGMEHRESRLRQALEPLSANYDYIMIDSPPSLGILTLNGLSAAHSVIVPIQCEYYALEGVGQLMNTLNLVRARLNPELEVEGVVLTMLDGRTNLGLQVVGEVKKYFKSQVYGTVIPRNVRLSEAPSHGLPIHLYDARCQGALAYTALAQEVIRRREGN
ncbi:MAG TPA: ParA family protein [Candidatus Fimadaptatus faecigallinarum]|uniref:Sporulation initiation inhibitor protein Soj n=1 Tax=Candidatus Fimadaptatus faecigallinarum TaxID=2840814 RepID=A0A9D1LT76_9FIRM|nr:ParA family protein [Candidatus Fimadaptatus faecigallinarum]